MWKELLLTFTLLAALIDQNVSGKLVCPQQWLLKLGSCYRWGPSKMPFHQAKSLCANWGSKLRVITNDKENELFKAPMGKGELYWLGVQKKGFEWTMEKNGKDEVVKYSPRGSSLSKFDHFSHFGDHRECIVWDSSYQTWKAVNCHSSPFLFICQKDPASKCPPGQFGPKCVKKCKCKAQEPCDPYTGTCPRGCQIGWSGTSCSKEKKQAQAKFYCFKVQNDNMLLLHINQRGTRYRTVTAYNKDGTESPGCNKTHFKYFEPAGMATLQVIQKDGVFAPSCGANKREDGVITWRFKFQEFPKMSSVADILFDVSCDFKKAESLTRLEAYTIEIPPPRRVKVEESKALVNFHIVDPNTEEKLTKVKLGQEVKLQLKLDHKDGDEMGVTGISPYNCSVTSTGGLHSMVFKDENGCTPNGSRIILNSVKSNAAHSATFEAFTFPGQAAVNFRCSYRVCFSEEKRCQAICDITKKGKKKNGRVKAKKIQFREKNPDALGMVGAHLGLFG